MCLTQMQTQQLRTVQEHNMSLTRNGYYDKIQNRYLADSVETWDGDSAGQLWDDFASWNQTPTSPLRFYTDVVDTGVSDYYNPIVKVDASGPVSITVYHSNSVDSAGALVTPSSFAGGQSQTLSSAKARYWQFQVDVTQQTIETPYIQSITSTLKSTPIEEVFVDVNTANFVDGAGLVTFTPNRNFSTITNAFFTLQDSAPTYMADGYVAANYVAEGEKTFPVVYLQSKANGRLTFEVRDVDTYGKTITNATCDIKIQGLPTLISDANGNIVEEL